jgi:hypothetical protein
MFISLYIKFQADNVFFYRTDILISRHNILLAAREMSKNEARQQSQNETASPLNSRTLSSEPPPAEPPQSLRPLKGLEIDDKDWSGYFFLVRATVDLQDDAQRD